MTVRSERQREAEELVQGKLGNVSETDYDPRISGPDVHDDPGRGKWREPPEAERAKARAEAERVLGGPKF